MRICRYFAPSVLTNIISCRLYELGNAGEKYYFINDVSAAPVKSRHKNHQLIKKKKKKSVAQTCSRGGERAHVDERERKHKNMYRNVVPGIKKMFCDHEA